MIVEDSSGFRVPIWVVGKKILEVGLIHGMLKIVTNTSKVEEKLEFLGRSMGSELKKIKNAIIENRNIANSPNVYEDEEELTKNLREINSPNFTPDETDGRQYRKKVLVDIRGGSCEKCNYSKNFAALDFHHPGKKNFTISQALTEFTNRQFEEVLIPEVKKYTILLCANCHREEHHEKCIR